jgi:hypothetical protein
MTTSTLGAFRYAGIAALPICVALALVTGVTAHRDLTATGRGPQATPCIIGEAQRRPCVGEAPTTLDEVPFLGELTVTGTRLEVAPPEVRSASDRSRPPRPQAKPSRASYPSVL